VDPGGHQAPVSLIDVVDRDGQVGSARVADPDIAASPAGRDVLDEFQVVGRSAPGLPRHHELRDPEVSIRVSHQSPRVLVGLLLAMDEPEAEEIAVERDRSFQGPTR
jgi:hypothetical protein